MTDDIAKLVDRLRGNICGSRGFAGPSCCVLSEGHSGQHQWGIPTPTDKLHADAADLIESLAADAGRYKTALERIVSGIPACHNGELVVEHYGPDGEWIGTEHVDPMAIIGCIVGAAQDALKDAAIDALKEEGK